MPDLTDLSSDQIRFGWLADPKQQIHALCVHLLGLRLDVEIETQMGMLMQERGEQRHHHVSAQWYAEPHAQRAGKSIRRLAYAAFQPR